MVVLASKSGSRQSSQSLPSFCTRPLSGAYTRPLISSTRAVIVIV